MLSYSFPSVLAHAVAEQVQMDPFPHLVVEHCLPPDLYLALAHSYPAEPAGSIAPLWQAFVRRHTSPEFFRDVVRVFGPALAATRPELGRTPGRLLDDAMTGVRFQPGGEGGLVALDCRISSGVAAPRPSDAQHAAPDGPEAFFSMRLFVRQPTDGTLGENTLVAFVGSDRAQHAVSSRHATGPARRLLVGWEPPIGGRGGLVRTFT